MKFHEDVDSNPTLARTFTDLMPSRRNLIASDGARPLASSIRKLDSDIRIRAYVVLSEKIPVKL